MKRIIQLITGIHRIHSVKHSYGYKIPFLNYAVFDNYGLQKIGFIFTAKGSKIKEYHDCTLTNRY